MPSPARSTGTTSGGWRKRVPVVGPIGVSIGIDSTAMSRLASYTRIPDRSSMARRNAGSIGAGLAEASEQLRRRWGGRRR